MTKGGEHKETSFRVNSMVNGYIKSHKINPRDNDIDEKQEYLP